MLLSFYTKSTSMNMPLMVNEIREFLYLQMFGVI